MRKLQINVFDTNLNWVGMVEEVESLILRSAWNEFNHSELKVNRNIQGIEELKIGRILVVNNDRNKALIIEDMSTELDDQFWTFTCIPLKGMLNYRICHPLDSGDYLQTLQAEVMFKIVQGNLVTQTRDNDRKFLHSVSGANMFSVAPISSFGDFVDYTIDWKNGYIGDCLTDISNMYGKSANYPLGFNVYIKEDYSGFEFNVWHGTHKHVNQSTLSPVVFSEEFGNIKNATYEYSIKEWRNVVYSTYMTPTGQTNAPVGNTTHGATKGFNRKEMIVDSGKEAVTEAIDVGHLELNKRPHVESFSAEIIHNPNTMSTYIEDWVLGDIVTVQSKAIVRGDTVSIDAMIMEVEEIYENGEYNINATFGEGKLSLIRLIKNEIGK